MNKMMNIAGLTYLVLLLSIPFAQSQDVPTNRPSSLILLANLPDTIFICPLGTSGKTSNRTSMFVNSFVLSIQTIISVMIVSYRKIPFISLFT